MIDVAWRGVLAGTLLAASALAHADDVALDIGGRSILVPLEPGYVAVSERSPELHRWGQAALPASNRLVETFHTEANLAALLRGELADGHYYMVQTMRSVESTDVSLADWQAMQSGITRGMVDSRTRDSVHADDAARSARLSEVAGREVAMRFGELEAPEIYARTRETVRFLMNIPAKVEVEGEVVELSIGAAGAMVLVKDRIVFVYWYAVPASPESIDEARRKLDAMVTAMVRRNGVEAVAGSTP